VYTMYATTLPLVATEDVRGTTSGSITEHGCHVLLSYSLLPIGALLRHTNGLRIPRLQIVHPLILHIQHTIFFLHHSRLAFVPLFLLLTPPPAEAEAFANTDSTDGLFYTHLVIGASNVAAG
jgi:hypothetical protein